MLKIPILADGLDMEDEIDEMEGDGILEPFSNSRLSFGKSRKPKRQFIMPSLRQVLARTYNR